MTPRLISAFWKTVADCLVQFFDVDEEKASEMVLSFRAASEDRPVDRKRAQANLIYHSEPIHIASDLAGKEPRRDEMFYRKYQALQRRNLKSARARAPKLEYSVAGTNFHVETSSLLQDKSVLVETAIGKKTTSKLKQPIPNRLANTRQF